MNTPPTLSARIMVVDDDPFTRQMLRAILTAAGCDVRLCSDAATALREAAPWGAEMILLDVQMEGLDGFAALDRLRADPATRSIPVIFVTGDNSLETLANGFQAGAVDYVIKPIRRLELLARVQAHLQVSRLSTERQRQNAALEAEIAARARALAQVEAIRHQWQATFDSIQDLILLTDDQNRIVRANAAARRRFAAHGFPAIDGLNLNFLFLGADQPCLCQFPEIAFPDSDELFSVAAYPVASDEFGERFSVFTLHDITRRKQMEAALLAAQKFASLGTLVAGIAHEINSPLQVITGLSSSLERQLAADQLEPERLRRGLESMRRNAWRVAEIVRALRLYAHDSPPTFEPHDLNLLIGDTLLLVEHQLESWGNVTVRLDLGPDLPALPCDREKIIQVLINLLTNARDAMPTGGRVVIRTAYHPQQDQIELSVTDTGPGIPPEVLAKIFDPFFTTKPLGAGTGLGLSIVQGIVRSHGGAIEVLSPANQGATFRLYFPAGGQPPRGGAANFPAPAADVQGRFDDPPTS